jgi:hypothetical protein
MSMFIPIKTAYFKRQREVSRGRGLSSILSIDDQEVKSMYLSVIGREVELINEVVIFTLHEIDHCFFGKVQEKEETLDAPNTEPVPEQKEPAQTKRSKRKR